MKQCNNLECGNNKKGYCCKEIKKNEKNVYDTLSIAQWKEVRKYLVRKSKKFKPFKECKNAHCVNNIKGWCYLPSEIEVLNIIL